MKITKKKVNRMNDNLFFRLEVSLADAYYNSGGHLWTPMKISKKPQKIAECKG
jgi:hypothetical protein